MSEPCSKENELGKLQATVEMVKKEIFNGDNALSKSVPVLSNQIGELTKIIGELRTAVSGLAKFKDETTGGKNTIKSIAPWIAIVLTAAGLWFAMNRQVNKTVKSIEEDVGNKLYYKADRIPDSTTRNFIPIYDSTAIK